MTEETREELLAKLQQAEADKKALKEKVDEGSKVIDDMQQTIDKKTAQTASGSTLLTVKVDKKEYQIRVAGKVRFKGKDYSAEDIQKNKSLAGELVKIKAAYMIEVQ